MLDKALRHGFRWLPGNSSLAQLLEEKRGRRNRRAAPKLTTKAILAWADEYKRRCGEWPTESSGKVPGATDESWIAIASSLRTGARGLPGGSSLSQLLEKRRGKRNMQHQPELSVAQILTWADTHRERTGKWPTKTNGSVRGVRDESWGRIDGALRYGRRSLPPGGSLHQLLEKHRGRRNRRALSSPLKKQRRIR
ncbi:MAG: hypothetical protein V3W34_06030 [Phycisphaerae bacterium]